ncbi:MAG: hypothetical protein R3B06_14020 [Kofleriaceae bacterium]
MRQVDEGALQRQILEAVAVASATGRHAAEPLASISDIEPISLNEFRYFGYELRTALVDDAEKDHAQLVRLQAFDLTSAPEPVAVIPTSADGRSVVSLTRYTACVGERLKNAADPSMWFRPEACRRFWDEMQRLAAAGIMHPFARHPMHWWVGEDSGTIVLDSWSAVRYGSPSDIEELLRTIRNTLDWRTQQPAGEEEAMTFDGRLNMVGLVARWRADPRSAGAERGPAFHAFLRQHLRARLRIAFDARRVLLPVIHPVSHAAAMANARLVVEAGGRGVFVINQGMNTDEVLRLVLDLRAEFPSLWVGINLLGMSPAAALHHALDRCQGRVDGLWADNADVSLGEIGPRARELLAMREKMCWLGLYFGGVAFKYQTPVADEDLEATARLAADYVDVVTTSGPGTGMEADQHKTHRMRRGLGGDGALALASGVTATNADRYLDDVDICLVGTGLEREFGVFDPERVRQLFAVFAARA